jgi:hypothetical protein
MPIGTICLRPAFPQPSSFGGEGTGAREAASNTNSLRYGRLMRGEDRSKLLYDCMQPRLTVFKRICRHFA